jgi:hypothetical protein
VSVPLDLKRGALPQAARRVPVLPASWDLVFSSSKLERRANAQREKIVALPLEIESWIAAGERDGLIRRLVGFGMAEGNVAKLTGATVYRVRGIGAALAGRREA